MSTSPSNEQTFRSYTPSDAELYAQNRQRYSDGLYQKIFDYHTSTGGELGTVVDVGCGRKYLPTPAQTHTSIQSQNLQS